MYLAKVAKVYIQPPDEKGQYTATDIESNRIYRPVYFTTPTDRLVIAENVSVPALLMEIRGQYFCFGYFTRSQDLQSDKVWLMDGETLIKLGEARAVIFSPTGTMGIYAVRRKEDGTLMVVPKVEYTEDDDVLVEFGSMIMSMYGSASHGNIALERIDGGRYKYKFEGKTNQSDGAPRFSMTIEPSMTGPIYTLKVDNVPTAINPTPKPGSMLPISSTTIKMGSQGVSPTATLLELSVNNGVTLSIKRDGSMDMVAANGLHKTSISPIGATSINVNNIGKLLIDNTGKIELNSGVGKMKMTPDGKFEVGTSSAQLMTILNTILDILLNHVHMTGVGVSTPPIPPDVTKFTQEKAKVTMIKGTL